MQIAVITNNRRKYVFVESDHVSNQEQGGVSSDSANISGPSLDDDGSDTSLRLG